MVSEIVLIKERFSRTDASD